MRLNSSILSSSNLVRKVILTLFAAFSIIPSCKEENYPPVASLEVNPVSGEVPLNVRMKVTGFDENGPKDISWYSLNIDNKNIKRNYPIDTTITFSDSGIHNVYGEVIDSQYERDKTETTSIEVYGKPFIEQSVSLFNDIEIKYDATLFRVNEANLNVKKNGEEFFTKKVIDANSTGTDYQKTFTYTVDGLTKGNYEFTLTSEDLEKKTSVEVPNYTPTLSSSLPSVNFLEETDTTFIIPSDYTDKNLEDVENISWTEAISLDNKIIPTLIYEGEATKLKLKGNRNQTGAYQVRLKFGSASGGLEEKILTGNIAEDNHIYYLRQPNDSTDNWYGSGNIVNYNNVGEINQEDVNRLNEIINGTFSDPSDIRLMDRADVDGNGSVNISDLNLLQNYVNKILAYLPGHWNKLQTRAEQESWITKMMPIYQSFNYTFPGGDCSQFSDQGYIVWHGVEPKDISKFQEVYPYDFSKNGLFNLPLLKVGASNSTGAHAMNSFILGRNPGEWNNLCNIEFQLGGKINVQPGEAYLGTDLVFRIRGPPLIYVTTYEDETKAIIMGEYLRYEIKNGIPTLIWENSNLSPGI